jgi:hypothetical protein
MDLNVSRENNTIMPKLVLNEEMINMFTNPNGFNRLIENYKTSLKQKKEYYSKHREEILAKRRQKYAEANPEPKRKRKESDEIVN